MELGGAERIALRGEPAGGVAIRLLMVGVRPERVGEEEVGEDLVRDGLLKHGLNRGETARYFRFVAAGDDEPERVAAVAEAVADEFGGGVSLAARGAERVGGVRERRQAV